ncbi:MAG: phage holin family protein [Dehalococcoidia bacterium]
MARQSEPRLLALAVRLGVNAAALWLASEWVRGFDIDGWQSVVAAAAIFAAVNAVIKPVAELLGLPITCLTMGLFALVINTAMLALTAWIAGQLDFNVDIDGFIAAFLAALLVSVVSALLSTFVGRPIKRVLR